MITQSPTFCPAPWTSLNIDQTGRVSPCMHHWDSLGSIKQNTIQEIIQGPGFTDLKNHMLQGKWSTGCRDCRNLEEVTGSSPRTVRKSSAETLQAINNNITWFAPEHLVINWSNLCNLTCTYCNSDTSTAWQAIKGIPIQHVKNEHADLLLLAREQGQHVQGLTLGGGEPLLQKGLVDFLRCLNPDKVRVLVTTNLTVDLINNPVYQELKNWKQVEWQISFDNANRDRFEYVRMGANWSQFEKNIDTMVADQQLVKAHPAYSLYCAFDLENFYNYCVEKNILLFWCDLTHPWDLDVRRLSKPIRELAQQQIDIVVEKFGHLHGMAVDTLQRYRKQLDDNSNLVNIDTYRADPLMYSKNIEATLGSKHTFEQLWPEVVDLLDQHWYHSIPE